LVTRAASGDGGAFEDIFERYHQDLYRYALSILRDPQDAQDVLQSTMERAMRSIAGQRVRGGLKAWLFGIAHNESMDALGKRRGAPSQEVPLVAADAAADAGDRARTRQLVADLGTLPERQRSALVLRELSGLDSGEIGSALSISPAAANQSVYEARVALTALAEGRDMSCERVQQKISAGDGRRLRGRRLKAHLRDCALCQAFTAGIGTRTVDLPCLFGPLAAAAAAKTFSAATASAAVSATPAPVAGSAGGSASRSVFRDRRAAAGIGVIALLALGGALAATRSGEDPGVDKAAATEAPSDPLKAAPGDRPVGETSSAPPESASVSGYSSLDPSATTVLGEGGSGGDGSSSGATAADSGGSDAALAFTGLDVGLLAVAGLLLIGLGLSMRHTATRHV